MNLDSTDPILTGFEEHDVVDVLLKQIGIQTDTGSLVASHLLHVLQVQHSDLRLESVKLLAIGECTAGGQRGQEEHATEIKSLEIPFELEAIVTVQDKQYQLELVLILRAVHALVEYDVESDLVIRKQSLM